MALLLIPLALAACVLWRRRLGAALLVFATVACLALAVARPQWATRTQRVARLYLLDTSGSVFLDAAKALEAVRRSMAELGSDDRVGLIAFAAAPAVALPLRSPRAAPEPLALPAAPSRADATDIAAALRLAARQLAGPAHDRQVILLSDGRQTGGDAALEAALAADAGLRVFAVPVGPADVADARVSIVTAPSRVRVGQPFQLEVEVAATASLELTLRVTRDGHDLCPPRLVTAEPGAPRRFAVADRLARPAAVRYAATLSVADRCSENNSAEAIIRAEGATRVLCLSPGDTALARILAALPGLEVARERPGDARALATSLQAADCVVIDGLPAGELSPAAQGAIRDWVRDAAGGLIALGGPSSYGPGGYAGTPIEEALPLLCSRPKQIALVVALDRSGSMAERVGGRTKIAFARDAVSRAVGQLHEGDSFGLLTFAAEATVAVPLGPVPTPEALARGLDAIEPHGPTELRHALDEAIELVAPSPAQVRHIILLSDGQVTDEQAAALRAADFRTLLARRDVTLSALLTGRDPKAVALLQELAGASFHLVENPADLPAVFLDELRKATFGRFIHEGVTPVRALADAEVSSGVAPGRLRGYVRTVAKGAATAEWVAGDPPDPILARWQFGLGRALGFASTVGTQWDEGFLPPQATGRLWQQVVRWAARPPATPGFDAQVTERGDDFCLAVRAEREGRFLNGLDLTARVAPPQGEAHDVALRQAAPGEYQASFPAPHRGAYHLTITERDKGQRLALSVAKNYSSEWEAFGVDDAAIEAIARSGRGAVLNGFADLRAIAPQAAAGAVEVDWVFLAAALALFVLDVALRVARSRQLRL